MVFNSHTWNWVIMHEIEAQPTTSNGRLVLVM
jgi:hypothetical protein